MPGTALSLFHALCIYFLDNPVRLVLFYSHFTEEEIEAQVTIRVMELGWWW